MFSSLNQGSLIYILDKASIPKLIVGEVVSVSQPKQNYQGTFQQTYVDIKAQCNGTIYEFNQIPSNFSIVSYNNGKLTLSETKQQLQSEVESIIHNSKTTLDNIDTYKENIKSCEEILKDLNPQFAKDAERDTRLNNLENKVDKLITLLQNRS